MSVATSSSTASTERKVEDSSSVDVVSLETPQVIGAGLSPSVLNAAIGSTAGFPTTPELKKYLTMNPFEIKFREANRRISQSSQELLEQNGLVPPTIAISSAGGVTMLKLPSSFSSQSPSLFPSLNVLSADIDPAEALKTADIAKLVQQMKESGSSLFTSRFSTEEAGNQTPRTADVLNAVLDMHNDRLSSINYLNASSNTAASVAAAAAAVANASCIATAPSSTLPSTLPQPIPSTLMPPLPVPSIPKSVSPVPLRKASEIGPPVVQVPQLNSTVPSTVVPSMYPPLSLNTAPSDGNLLQPTTVDTAGISPHSPLNMTQLKAAKPDGVISMNASGSQYPGVITSDSLADHWNDHDVKPVIHKRSLDSLHSGTSYYHDDYGQKSKEDDSPNSLGMSNESQVSSTRAGRGRGRGASITTELPADERRLTILERNKAAAVRYRKRKKEEHDEMLGRVHVLEQDKVSLTTQNTVLRRELERVTALLKAREARCVCRANQIMCAETGRSDSPIDILSTPLQQQVVSNPNDLTGVAAGPASLYLPHEMVRVAHQQQYKRSK